ncbi:hypothetical protein D3C79_660800 [compost metagenome]
MGLEGVREAARRNKGMQFTALLHHITPQLLAQSFYALRRDAAVGVDSMSWREALKRRSQRNRLQWSRYGRLAGLYIPRPRNAHPYPEDRFASHTRGRSRMDAETASVRKRKALSIRSLGADVRCFAC